MASALSQGSVNYAQTKFEVWRVDDETLWFHIKTMEKSKGCWKRQKGWRRERFELHSRQKKLGWTSQAEVIRVPAHRLVSIHLASPHRYLYLRLYVFIYLCLEGLYLLTHSLPTSVDTNTIQVERVVTRGNGKGISGFRALVFTIDILKWCFLFVFCNFR